jgi:hypothetical protein
VELALAGGAPLSSANVTALAVAVYGWNSALIQSYPPSPLLPSYASIVRALLAAGAGDLRHLRGPCPLSSAAHSRNLEALALLLPALDVPTLTSCFSEADAGGALLLHHVARTPVPGLSRLLTVRHRLGAASSGEGASALGFSNGFPVWEGGTLRKDAVELAAGAPEAPLLAAALKRLAAGNASAAAAAFSGRDAGRGWTPLDTACAHGRAGALITWLAVRGGGAQGARCAHLAAAAGHAGALEAAAGAGVPLGAPDAGGATPCERAQAMGAMGAAAAAALARVGACGGEPAPPPARCPAGPAHLQQALPLTLPPSWNAAAHAAAGWRRLSASRLDELRAGGVGGVEVGIAPGGPMATGTPPCALDEVPLSDLAQAAGAPARAAVDVLHLSLGRPFISRALNASSPLLSRSALLASLGDVRVAWGGVPYAAEYGGEGAAVGPLRNFVGRFMGTAVGGEPTEGPGAALAAPPLVFDAEVLKGPAAPLAALFARRRALVFPRSAVRGLALQQFIMGPGGAGSSLHFHPSAVNLCLFGLKHWLLVPPAAAAFTDAPAAEWWPTRARAGPAFEVLQGPGDFVYVPDGWGHAVLNLADSLALAFEARN